MLNKWIGIGRLGSDPEMRYTPAGKAVCKFDIAVEDHGKTTWVPIVTWEKTAESCAKYLAKGRTCAVVGRLEIRSYEKDGIKRKAAEIVAENVRFIGGGQEPKGDAYEAPESPAAAAFEDDNIPF